MTFKAGVTTAVGDRRMEGTAVAMTADGSFESGYYVQINTASGAQIRMPVRMNANYTPGVGGGVVVRGEIRICGAAVGAPAWAPGVTAPQFRISGTLFTATISNGDVGMLINGAQQIQPFAYMGGSFYYTTAANFGPTTLTDDTYYGLEMKVEVISDTQLKISVKRNSGGTWTLLGSETLTAGTGWSTQAWYCAFYGGAYSGKLTGIFDMGNIAVCSLEGAVPNDWFSDLNGWKTETILPNGDVGGETDWTGNPTGAPNKWQNWDDAATLFSTADYNHAGTGAGAETQASDFAATSGTLLSTDAVVAVSAWAANGGGGPAWGGNVSIVSDDGTEDAQVPVIGTYAEAYTFLQGGSGAWTKASIDGANFKLRTAANSTDYRCEAFWVIVWSYTPPAATPRSFAVII